MIDSGLRRGSRLFADEVKGHQNLSITGGTRMAKITKHDLVETTGMYSFIFVQLPFFESLHDFSSYIDSRPACFISWSPVTVPYATLVAPLAFSYALWPTPAFAFPHPGLTVAFAKPSSAYASGEVHHGTDAKKVTLPLFESSFNGWIFEVSITPGKPSTTPAVCLKVRAACAPPSKL